MYFIGLICADCERFVGVSTVLGKQLKISLKAKYIPLVVQ